MKEAWDAYFDAKLVKCLPEADKPTEGEALEAAFERLVKRDAENAVWSKDVRAKEEKFGLILGSLVSMPRASIAWNLSLIRCAAIRSYRSIPSQ